VERFIGRKEYFGALFYDRAAHTMLTPLDRKSTLILEALQSFTFDQVVEAFDGILTQAQVTSIIEKRRSEGLLDEALRLQGLLLSGRESGKTLSAPTRIYLSVTNACNLRCRHCSSGSTHGTENELTLAEITDIFGQAARAGVFQANITGGEPLLRPDIMEILEIGTGSGLSVSLTTNGTLLTNTAARRLSHLPLHYIVLSLDGVGEATHEFIRGRGTHGKVMRALRLLKDETPHEVSLQFTVMKHNRGEIPALFRMAEESPADILSVTILRPAGRALENRGLWISAQEYADLLDELSDLALSFSKTLIVPRDFSENYPRRLYEGIGCSAANLSCNVSADGRLLPCNYFEGPQWQGETLRGGKGLIDIWHEGEAFKRLRDLPGNPRCLACPELDKCRGYCRASAWNQTGDVNAPDSLCLYPEESA
jgi:radical SAM protein with 4Fe4S-binding SPASM domain